MFCITTHAEDLGELYKIIAKGTPVGKNDSGLSFRERIFLGEAPLSAPFVRVSAKAISNGFEYGIAMTIVGKGELRLGDPMSLLREYYRARQVEDVLYIEDDDGEWCVSASENVCHVIAGVFPINGFSSSPRSVPSDVNGFQREMASFVEVAEGVVRSFYPANDSPDVALRLRVDPYFVYPEFVPERGHRLDHRAQLPIGFRS